MSYNQLDMTNIIFKKEPTPSSIALQDVEPFDWEQDVLDGKRKITITKQPEDARKCVNAGT